MFKNTLYSNIIFHVDFSKKGNTKFNNIPQEMFDTMLSKARMCPSPIHSKHFVLFYGTDNTKFEICLDSNPYYFSYFKLMLKEHMDNAQAHARYGIRKSITYSTKPRGLDYQLTIHDNSTELLYEFELLSEFWNGIKIVHPQKSKPFTFYYKSTKQCWMIWMDEYDIIYFQPQYLFEYANGQCVEHRYGIKIVEMDEYYELKKANKYVDSQTKTMFLYLPSKYPILRYNYSPKYILDKSLDVSFFEYKENTSLESLPIEIFSILHVLNPILKRRTENHLSNHLSYEKGALDMLHFYVSECIRKSQKHLIGDILEDWNLKESILEVYSSLIRITYFSETTDEEMKINICFNKRQVGDEWIPHLLYHGETNQNYEESIYYVEKTDMEWKKTVFGRYLEKLRLSFLLKKAIIFHDSNQLCIHPMAIQKFPEYLMKKCTTCSLANVQFLDDNLNPQTDPNATKKFMGMLLRSLFKPIALEHRVVLENFERMLDMDRECRFPKFTLERSNDQKQQFTSDLLLFADMIIERKLGNIANFLPSNFKKVLQYLDTFAGLCSEKKILFNDIDQFTTSMHFQYHNIIIDLTLELFPHCDTLVAFASFIKDYIPFEKLLVGNASDSIKAKSDQYFQSRKYKLIGILHHFNYEPEEETDAIAKLFDLGMKSILRPKVEPILEFLFYFKMAMPQMKHRLWGERLKKTKVL